LKRVEFLAQKCTNLLFESFANVGFRAIFNVRKSAESV
jgi:hypothetical protein